MAYADDLKDILRKAGEPVGSEIALYGRDCVVFSGHKGLTSLSSEEVVVRLGKGGVRVVGEELKVEKASPQEIYLRGNILSLSFFSDREEGGESL